MADFRSTTTVDAPEGSLFDYLAEVQNLPTYFARMTSASPGDGDEVHTTARMPDGTEVAGSAWFRADHDAKRIEWGSEGEHDYHGSLDVTARSGGSQVEVRIHTSRVPADDQEIPAALDETLATIKRLVEGQYATR